MSASKTRAPILASLYNHNPFYAISTVLMLFAVRNAYGELTIGAINCWIMMGVLAAYTVLLAVIGILIVRKGKVWEDARSIALLLLILFLAVSISGDDLFAGMESSAGGGLLVFCGYIFSAVVAETFLRGARIRLGAPYRVPLHLFLALFYIAPWWCSPELHPRSAPELEWTLFLFPVIASFLILALLPAVRRGPAYVDDNGTPWRWPWYPWTAFGFIIGAVALRTFALCMTFGPSGPIWVNLSSGALAISFDTMWGPYFLIPLALAVAVLLLEAGLVTKNRLLVQRVCCTAPLLLALSVPISDGAVFRGFLTNFTEALGSPIWLTVWLLFAFYTWAWLRRVPAAGFGALAAITLLAVVGPRTLGARTLTEPQTWPIVAVGLVLLFAGLRARSSRIMTASCAVLTFAVWLVLPDTPLSGYRMSVSYHLLWSSVVIFGLVHRDRFAEILRIVGAAQMPLASIVILAGPHAAEVPIGWRLAYVVALTIACIAIAKLWRTRWYLYAFTVLLAMAGYGATVQGFRGAVSLLGRAATTSFVWSVAALLMALLISAHKANWLPQRLIPRWGNGRGGTAPTPPLEAAITPTEPPDWPGGELSGQDSSE